MCLVSISFSHTFFEEVCAGASSRVAFIVNGLTNTVRIVDRHFELHVAEVATAEAFRQAKRCGLWMSGAVEPALVVEPPDVTTNVSPSHRPTEYPSQWIGILGKIAPVGEHRSMRAVGRLIHDQRERWRLNDPGQIEKIVEWDADGQAMRERLSFRESRTRFRNSSWAQGCTSSSLRSCAMLKR